MALSATDISKIQATIRFAVEHNCSYGTALETWPTTKSWDGLAAYDFTELGMDDTNVSAMWSWVANPAHLPASAKAPSSDDQDACVSVGDVLEAIKKASQ